ncbi:MAG: hypothetical protein JKY37_11785 [Nannocystaceae bacterium]|nr:hypothetical protein [Nannocystaceae bacterium]
MSSRPTGFCACPILTRRLTVLPLASVAALLASFAVSGTAGAVGDASTRFNVFVPPNDHSASRAVSLIVTNVSPFPVTVDIIDDDADGDDDDTVLGVVLARGQSQIIRLADGEVDDDRGGIRDGDYFRIIADHAVVVQMATASNWQHDWVPAEGGGARGRSFFVYAPPTSGADNDINIFSYQDGTVVSVRDITVTPSISTGTTQIDLDGAPVVLETTLDEGEDLNVRENGAGLDILDPGHTYWVQATEPVTVQYGHLGQITGGNQARDGAGFVPSANGSSAGSLFFFTIPHNPGRESEKELRIVCPEPSQVSLFGATSEANAWTPLTNEAVVAGGHMDLVGASNAAFRDAEVYRLEVDPPYNRCTVFEGNWMETGSYGTSDFASGVSSDNGTNLGHTFTAYVGPPGRQLNVVDPTGELTNNSDPAGGLASHLYLYAFEDDTSVTVTDVDTSGALINHTLLIDTDEYYDFVVDTADFAAITSDGNRPYLRVASSRPVMVMNGNFNDNWMAFFHSVVPSDLLASVSSELPGNTNLNCGDALAVEFRCDALLGAVDDVELVVSLPQGVTLADDDPTASLTATSATWVLGALAPGASISLARTFDVECALGGCPADGLVALTAECRGTALGELRTAVASYNFTVRSPQSPVISEFRVHDDPDYDGDPSEPGVDVVLEVEFPSPAYTISIHRAVNDADIDAPQQLLATLTADDFSGNSTVVTRDPYALHYEETRLYRVTTSNGACSRSVGPIGVQTSSGASGGEDSGLESNGRLGAALARRTIARSRSQGWIAPAAAERLAFRGGHRSESEAALRMLLPTVGPANSVPVDATPTDLVSITNATAVVSVDYHDEASQTVASALIVESRGEVYEHAKALCDRASGSRLSNVHASAEPDGKVLRFASQHSRSLVGEYAVEVKLYEQPGGGWIAHSLWLHDNYPPVAVDQRVLNVQAWSPRPGLELAILHDVLERSGATWGLIAEAPQVYVRRASTLGSSVDFELSPRSEGSGLQLRLSTRATDGEWVVRGLSIVSARKSRYSSEPFAEATLEVVDASGSVVDRVWMSDGAWTALDDSMWGGETLMHTWSNDGCPDVSTPGLATDSIRLDGCASVHATVSDFAGVARHIGGGSAPLRSETFGGVEFWLRSSRELKVCLEDLGRPAEDQACVLLAARPDGQYIQIPRAAFRSLDTCAPLSDYDVSLVSFVAIGEGELELEVSALTLTTRARAASTPISSCTTVTEEKVVGCGCQSQRGYPPWSLLALVVFFMRRRPRQTC